MALIVDRDDNIYEFPYRYSETEREVEPLDRSLMRWLGQAVYQSGNVTLSDYLSKEEIAFQARRKSLPNGIVIHAVLSRGFAKERRVGSLFFIHVLREQSGRVERILNREGDLFFEQCYFEDITGDGRPEIVLGGRAETGVSGQLHIWTVEADGELRKIGFEEHEGVNPFLHQFHPYSIRTTEDPKAEGSDIVRRRQQGLSYERATWSYGWDRNQGKYVLKSVAKELCTDVQK